MSPLYAIFSMYMYQCTILNGWKSEYLEFELFLDVDSVSVDPYILKSLFIISLHYSGSLHSSSSLALAWNPPSTDQQNGLVIPYFISIMDHETQETFNHTTFDKTFTFDDLLPFRRYSCIVATETRYGLGPYTVSLKTTSPKDGL